MIQIERKKIKQKVKEEECIFKTKNLQSNWGICNPIYIYNVCYIYNTINSLYNFEVV